MKIVKLTGVNAQDIVAKFMQELRRLLLSIEYKTAHTLVEIKLALKSKEVYHRLATQTKSTQVD